MLEEDLILSTDQLSLYKFGHTTFFTSDDELEVFYLLSGLRQK